jgi:hypothetical protein
MSRTEFMRVVNKATDEDLSFFAAYVAAKKKKPRTVKLKRGKDGKLYMPVNVSREEIARCTREERDHQ